MPPKTKKKRRQTRAQQLRERREATDGSQFTYDVAQDTTKTQSQASHTSSFAAQQNLWHGLVSPIPWPSPNPPQTQLPSTVLHGVPPQCFTQQPFPCAADATYGSVYAQNDHQPLPVEYLPQYGITPQPPNGPQIHPPILWIPVVPSPVYVQDSDTQFNAIAPDFQPRTTPSLNPRAVIFRPTELEARQSASVPSSTDVEDSSDDVEIVTERPGGDKFWRSNDEGEIVYIGSRAFDHLVETGNDYSDGRELGNGENGDLDDVEDGQHGNPER
jgi:hypothetical protein